MDAEQVDTPVGLKRWLEQLEWCPHCGEVVGDGAGNTAHFCEACKQRVVQFDELFPQPIKKIQEAFQVYARAFASNYRNKESSNSFTVTDKEKQESTGE